jgi:glycosyltransferase involved in cell wall biosynthesis
MGDKTIWNGIQSAPLLDTKIVNDAFTLGWVGRMETIKRPKNAIDIFFECPREWRLKMYGSGSMKEQTMLYAISKGVDDRIDFMGMTKRSDIYKAFDCLLVTSAQEGMPLVVLESMMAGIPVASYPVGDVPNLLAGNRGIVGTRETLANDIAKRINDLSTMSKNAQRYAHDVLSASRMGNEYACTITRVYKSET